MNNNELKYIQSFAHKKHWDQESVFIVEGPKLVKELLESDWTIEKIYASPEWLNAQEPIGAPTEQVDEIILARISQFKTANQVLALVKKKVANSQLKFDNEFTLVLDGIQDPGNFGALIRTADWFGITQIVCSLANVEQFNPKTIQASMGSVFRISIHYTNLPDFLSRIKEPIHGALLAGTSIYEIKAAEMKYLVLGNEGNGISKDVLSYITHPILIPGRGTAESLNVGIACGIFLAEWNRAL